jgi:hypothetical protein
MNPAANTRSKTGPLTVPKPPPVLTEEEQASKLRFPAPKGKTWRTFEQWLERLAQDTFGTENVKIQKTYDRIFGTKSFRPDVYITPGPSRLSAILDAKCYIHSYVGRKEIDQVLDYKKELGTEFTALVLALESRMSQDSLDYAKQNNVLILRESSTLATELVLHLQRADRSTYAAQAKLVEQYSETRRRLKGKGKEAPVEEKAEPAPPPLPETTAPRPRKLPAKTQGRRDKMPLPTAKVSQKLLDAISSTGKHRGA